MNVIKFPALIKADELIYKPNDFTISDLINEPESKKYSACRFLINSISVEFRSAHITPKKIGQFVTLWKRVGNSPIQPYDLSDPIQLFVISVNNNNHYGQFVFPKNVLLEKGIISHSGKGGKRAMRVYTPWDITDNPQAKATQIWQLNYFLDIPHDIPVNHEQFKKYYLAQ